MSGMGEGWYHAEGDPAGTVRYWDGQLWIGEPRAAQPPAPTATGAAVGDPILPPGYGTQPPAAPYAAVPGQYPQPGQYPPPAYGGYPQYPEKNQAAVALVVCLVGFFVCSGITAPISWKMAHDEIKAIDAGRRNPKDRSLAMVAKVLSIIMTVLLVLGVVAIIAVIALSASSGEFQ